ncbi:insertion element protein [Paenibacillus sp. TRM 82003]|nr:insertion element protein [Paenibacillus sp. TRM 82003]
MFRKFGKGAAGSQRWQCRTCGKFTNTRPKKRESFNYHQKRNDILPMLAACILGRVPVKRACEIIGFGNGTYYAKLELLYQRSLEFLERHETKIFQGKTFNEMYLDTDKFIYNLNNVRRKGKGGLRYDQTEEPQFPTHIVVSTEASSSYVFRADVAYDWFVNSTDISEQTKRYYGDHMDYYERKYARLRFDHEPQPPTSADAQSMADYVNELSHLRDDYIDGFHVNSSYTAYAHFWLLRQMVRAKEWRFITDNDASLTTALYRAFSREIRLGEAHHFLILLDREKSLKQAFNECTESRKELAAWAGSRGIQGSISTIAFYKLAELMEEQSFHGWANDGTKQGKVWARNPITHPLPRIDQGYYEVDCRTDLSSYEPEQIARMLLRVNDKSTNDFMQQIRRRLLILERPLTTARGNGKSYIYSNFNPKYAQYAVTFLRAYYNFCFKKKGLRQAASYTRSAPWVDGQGIQPEGYHIFFLMRFLRSLLN